MESHGRNSRQISWGISLLLNPVPVSGFSVGEGVKICTQSCITSMLTCLPVHPLYSQCEKLHHYRQTHPAGIILSEKLCGRRQWGQTDTDWETLLQGSPEQLLKSKRTACTHTGREWTTEQFWFWQDQHCGSDSHLHLLSGLKQLDLVSCMDAKLHSLPSVLRKSMLVGGSHMVGCAEISCRIFCVETKPCTSLPLNKPGPTNHRSAVNSPTVIKGFSFHKWQCLRLWVFMKTENKCCFR